MIFNKKGYVHFIEIIFTVLILSFIFSGFIEQKSIALKQNQIQNLEWQAWGALETLNELSYLTDELEGGNSTKIDFYIKHSLLNTQDFDWVLYNQSGCHHATRGVMGSPLSECDSINASTENDIVSVIYTIPSIELDTSQIRLYMWDKL